MLKSITLRNYKSFGATQEVPLDEITVIAGPNNSGKSCFMTLPRFIQNVLKGGFDEAVRQEQGYEFLVHRPPCDDDHVEVAWETSEGAICSTFSPGMSTHSEGTPQRIERRSASGELETIADGTGKGATPSWLLRTALDDDRTAAIARLLTEAVVLRLDMARLREDGQVHFSPELKSDGSGLAAVLGAWRAADDTRAQQLDEFLHACVPEITKVIVRNAPRPGYQRLLFRQSDGEEFDAAHVSDGLLAFAAIAMHVLQAGPGTVIFIEEPEHSVHPRRLRELIDLMREAVAERQCQFVIATHSTVVLDQFRDNPESILLFRRGTQGTVVRRCSDIPAVMRALEDASPGELLETAFFEALAGESGPCA